MKVYDTITQITGGTPLVEIQRLNDSGGGDIIAKLESFNPLSSVKDRIGVAMIEEAESKGMITADTTIIEPTSGNTGIALAFACAAKGYKLILTMPETMSIERHRLLKIFGAELVLTDGASGMKGAIEEAGRLVESTPHGIILQQFGAVAEPPQDGRSTGMDKQIPPLAEHALKELQHKRIVSLEQWLGADFERDVLKFRLVGGH